MLDQLLGEEHVFNTILSQRVGWHLDPGKGTPDLLETHRKLARRSRFQRECRVKYRSNILVRSLLFGTGIGSDDSSGEQAPFSTRETCLATQLSILEKQC